jgi:hypothetical protein
MLLFEDEVLKSKAIKNLFKVKMISVSGYVKMG